MVHRSLLLDWHVRSRVPASTTTGPLARGHPGARRSVRSPFLNAILSRRTSAHRFPRTESAAICSPFIRRFIHPMYPLGLTTRSSERRLAVGSCSDFFTP